MPNLSVSSLATAHWLAQRMSVSQVSSFGSFVGHRLGSGSKRTKRALANLTSALPETSASDRNEIVQRMWDNFGRTIAETLIIDKIAADQDRIILANPEVLDGCSDNDRGKVFVGLHFGNWEVMALPLAISDLKPLCVYRPMKDQAVNDWLQHHRERLCPGGLFPINRATYRRLVRRVRDGGAICIAGDHRDSNGPKVPFFDRPAPSVALPAMLAERYNAHLFLVRVDRLPDTRFSVFLERVDTQNSGDIEADTITTTAAIQAVFEDWIRADPGRWLWFYKRWGETDELDVKR